MVQTVSEFAFSISNLPPIDGSTNIPRIPDAPDYPPDIFLVMASLLESAGAYAHFDPASDNDIETNPPTFVLPKEDRDIAISTGQAWSQNAIKDRFGYIPDNVLALWGTFFRLYGEETVRVRADFKTTPVWWKHALELLIISDEASETLGNPTSTEAPKFIDKIHFGVFENVRTQEQHDTTRWKDSKLLISNGSAASFALSGRKEVANVFPKLNITTRGCSHRNFSKNLSLLPKTGTVRCHWHAPQRALATENEKTVDILLVPFPFEIPAKVFSEANPNHTAMAAMEPGSPRSWANFRIDQSLYNAEDIPSLTERLITAAKKDVSSVNGVIFPEYAMKFETFHTLGERIRSKKCEPELEFLVAGSSDNCQNQFGNYVLTRVWNKIEKDYSNAAEEVDFSLMSSRRKHHRWMLDGPQIDSYGLSSSLDPRINWWENHIAGFRELHFYPFRQNSLFTTLICEDLARMDPCHEVLKSVGPNLVFSLLMDGPQIDGRWPARYSKALSEDIGCSVLTLTSYGLIDRTNACAVHGKNETVAYFTSPLGTREIKLPYSNGARGVLLSLTSEIVESQCTIDGRFKTRRVWRLANSRPIYPI